MVTIKRKFLGLLGNNYDPDSLMARILKSKYFKNSSFLTCGMAVWEADRLMLGVA